MRSVKRLVLKVLYKTYFGAITGQAQGKEFESFQVTPGQSESSIVSAVTFESIYNVLQFIQCQT